MPNDETNHVMVIGVVSQIEAFIQEAFTDDHIDFNKIVPVPENIEKGSCSGTHEDGVVCSRNWNRENWGTKWNAYEQTHFVYTVQQCYNEATGDFDGHLDGWVQLKFMTAGSQPRPILKAIEDKWHVKVLALTQDDGGFPDVYYGSEEEVRAVMYPRTRWILDPLGAERMKKVFRDEDECY